MRRKRKWQKKSGSEEREEREVERKRAEELERVAS